MKVTIGSWMLLLDKDSKENIMVKVIDKDDEKRIATVEMDLAIRKTDDINRYVLEVEYEDLRQPRLKTKKRTV